MAYKGNMYSFVSYTDEGADGFMCFIVKKNEGSPPDFHVESLYFKTYEGLRGLLSYFATQTVCIGNEFRRTHRKVLNAGVTSGGEPDIEMDINAFASGIMGRLDLDSLPIAPNVKIYGNEENLRKVFCKKPGWIEEHY